jgi:hypothetical protein
MSYTIGTPVEATSSTSTVVCTVTGVPSGADLICLIDWNNGGSTKGQVIQRADLVAEAVMPLSANKMPTRIIQNNVTDDDAVITAYLTHETIEIDKLAESLTEIVKGIK